MSRLGICHPPPPPWSELVFGWDIKLQPSSWKNKWSCWSESHVSCIHIALILWPWSFRSNFENCTLRLSIVKLSLLFCNMVFKLLLLIYDDGGMFSMLLSLSSSMTLWRELFCIPPNSNRISVNAICVRRLYAVGDFFCTICHCLSWVHWEHMCTVEVVYESLFGSMLSESRLGSVAYSD